MRTSVDRGTPETNKHRWKEAGIVGSIILGSILLCLFLTWIIGCNNKASTAQKLPEIISFQANPSINAGDPVSYTFEVKNASKIVLIEAGETIKEINSTSSGVNKGVATGHVPIAELTSDNYTLDAVLEASNEQGTVKKTATLAGSAVLKINPQYGDRPCPTGCGCSAPLIGGVQTPCTSGCQGPIECQSLLLAENGYKKYCYQIPVQQCDTAAGCTCMETSQAPSGYVRCSDSLCAANPDKYCYRLIPVHPCDVAAGCTCMEPGQAPSNYTRCSDNLCASNPDKYCYSPHPCDTANGCICMEPGDQPLGSIKCSDYLCGYYPNKLCYRPPEACTCQWNYITFIAICLGGT